MKSKIPVLLVGCGGISRAWLDAVQAMDDIEMVSFVDLNIDAAKEKSAAYGWKDAFVTDDLALALDTTKPEAVFNCTIPEAHYEVTLRALAAGCHVLGEKPLADTMTHAQEMVTAAQEAGKIFAVIQNRRYFPAIRRLRLFIASGVLGRITTVNSDFYIGAHFGGFRDSMPHVLLLDMAIHTFDMARMITAANAKDVYCNEWNPVDSWYDHDASAVAIFNMTKDIVYTYRGSWCAEGLNTSWQAQWRIIGERGTLTWDGEDGFHVEVVRKTGGFFSECAPLTVPELDVSMQFTGHGAMIREFVDCISQEQIPETDAADNIHSLAMVLSAIQSAKAGQRVKIVN